MLRNPGSSITKLHTYCTEDVELSCLVKKALKNTLMKTRTFLNRSYSACNNCVNTNHSGKSCNAFSMRPSTANGTRLGKKLMKEDLSIQRL